MNKNPLTLTETTLLGIILSNKIESLAQLSIDNWTKGNREASALFENQKKAVMVIRNKLGLN